MFLSIVAFSSFRNYVAEKLRLPPGWVIIAGDNGQGKTNLLEAIAVACTGSSPRARQESEVIQFDQEVARVEATVTRQPRTSVPQPEATTASPPTPETLHLEVALGRQGHGTRRLLKVNGAAKSRLADFIGLAPVVTFSTEDIAVVKGEPAERRRFLNRALGATSARYYWDLTRYQRAVEQRNRLLKDLREVRRGMERTPSAEEKTLEEWDAQTLQYGSRLIAQRAVFLRELEEAARPYLRQLAGSSADLGLVYLPAISLEEGQPPLLPADAEGIEAWAKEAMAHGLARARGAELARGQTLVGPHRDDVFFFSEGIDLRRFGSQGQQRTVSIALRLGEADLLAQQYGEPPLVLLDDVLSELDETRCKGLLEAADKMDQVILTTCSLSGLPPDRLKGAHILRVEAGRILELPAP